MQENAKHTPNYRKTKEVKTSMKQMKTKKDNKHYKINRGQEFKQSIQ